MEVFKILSKVTAALCIAGTLLIFLVELWTWALVPNTEIDFKVVGASLITTAIFVIIALAVEEEAKNGKSRSK